MGERLEQGTNEPAPVSSQRYCDSNNNIVEESIIPVHGVYETYYIHRVMPLPDFRRRAKEVESQIRKTVQRTNGVILHEGGGQEGTRKSQ